MDAARLAAELEWLRDHPEFEERPATLDEFLGPDYLNIEKHVRKAIRDVLNEIIGDEVNGLRIAKYALAMVTGGIGIGKTTFASIVLPYMVHWCLCLKDPQGFFDLLPGSRIAFMQMSTSEKQALEVVFGDIRARIRHSRWFEKYPVDPNFRNQLRFPKDIWIIPGDSAETTFEGYNILGGILDEADSHKITPNKDYAEQGYTTISSRISSRFQDRGCLIVIGQMKSAAGFAARKYEEFRKRDDAYAVRMAIWDSMGDDFFRDADGVVKKFCYDVKRRQIVPDGAANLLGPDPEHILRIPDVYRREFENNPEKALRDLAGMPPAVGDPFISLTDRIEDCRDRWEARFGLTDDAGVPVNERSPVTPTGAYAPWFHCNDPLKRAVHIDIAYAANGDAMGIAMGHVREMVEIEGELKPLIVFDLLMRLTAPPGGEIILGDMRRVIYELRSEYKFKIIRATLDGFQSQDTIQQFNKRRIEAEYLSIDRQKLPYEDLREGIYERRIEFPRYMVRYRRDDTALTEVAYKELSELMDSGKKIDHPPEGSKDIADAMAGVVTTLMGDRRYAKRGGVIALPTPQANPVDGVGGAQHPAIIGGGDLVAPVPPSAPMWRNR